MKHTKELKPLAFTYLSCKPIDIRFYQMNQDIYISTEDLVPALDSTQLLTCSLLALKKEFLKPYLIEYHTTTGGIHFYLDVFGLVSFVALLSELDSYDKKRLFCLRDAIILHLANLSQPMLREVANG